MKKILLALVFTMLCFSAQAADYIVEKSPSVSANLMGIVVDTTNEANATTTYYYFSLVQDGWTAFSAQHKITNATVTYEGSNDLPNVANSSATWSDITSMLTSGSASSFTSNGYLSVNQPIPFSRLRIKRVTSSATNEVEIRLTKTILR